MSVSDNHPVLLSVVDLHKSYADIEVLRGLDIDFRAGEIHAFLGANGAGKSTFLGCLSGAVWPTQGHIGIGGSVHKTLTPRQAMELGIGIIYQHFQVFEGLTVAENIFLGHEIRKFGCVDRGAQNALAKELLARLGVKIDVTRLIDHLSTGERKIIEIARALNAEPRLLILDEPTAALGESEMSALHDVVRQIAHRDGIGVICVTHLLDEIEEIADVVTVLRDGQIVWTRPKSEISMASLAAAIAPSSSPTQTAGARPASSERPTLELRGYRSPFTGPIDLEVHAGEAIGIYGLLGSGRTDLLESLFGARPRSGGRLLLGGEDIALRSPVDALRHGISLVASDRADQSLFGSLSAVENLLMPHFGSSLLPKLARSPERERSLFARIAERLAVKPADPSLAVSNFSGGNAQKILLGRWLLDTGKSSQIILLDEPTQGVDIGARAQLYQALRSAMAAGASVIFASSDPAEIVELSDRVLVLGYGSQIALMENPRSEGILIEHAHRTAATMRVAV